MRPSGFGTEGERPFLLTSVDVTDIPERRNLIGDGVGVSIRFAVTACFRPCLRPQVPTDGSLAKLPTKKLKVVCLESKWNARREASRT